jgi:hypothetical protein
MLKSEYGRIVHGSSHTFDLLALVKHDIASNIHVITNKSISAGMLNGTFNRRLVLNHVHCESRPFGKRSVLVVGGFYLNTVKGDERCVARPLVAHILNASLLSTRILRDRSTYFDTVDSGFFLIYDNRIHVSAENDRNCQFILSLGRFA